VQGKHAARSQWSVNGRDWFVRFKDLNRHDGRLCVVYGYGHLGFGYGLILHVDFDIDTCMPPAKMIY
jgi:hypothetical protein